MYLGRRLPPAVVLVAAVALLAPRPGLALGCGLALVVALAAVDVLRAPRPRDLGARRTIPGVVRMGEDAEVVVRVRNPTDHALRIVLRDRSAPSLGRAPARHELRLGARAIGEARAAIRPGRRGWTTVGPLTVRVAGPVGLAGRQATLPIVDRVKVYPVLRGRRQVELRIARARLLQTGERSAAVRGGGTEFDSLAEYHVDDEFRRINWRATARSARPVVNRYREEQSQQVVVILDAGRAMAASVDGVSRFEHAIDAAVAVAELAGHAGDQVGCLVFSADVTRVVPTRGGRGQARRLVDALFDQEPTLEAPDYRRAFSSLLARQRRRALLLVLTELAHERAMDPLFEALPILLRRHLVVVGAVRDPETDRLSRSRPTSSEDAFLTAAAVGTLADRARTASRLGLMGVPVVDGPPGSLAGGVADQYLRIKSLGRL